MVIRIRTRRRIFFLTINKQTKLKDYGIKNVINWNVIIRYCIKIILRRYRKAQKINYLRKRNNVSII